jgi:hypothetical protein
MSQSASSPAGVGGGAGISQNVMSADTGAAATQDVVGVPQFGGVMNGLQNMLGKTRDERVTNAKALAAVVKDVSSLATTASETTLLQRMMEAQSNGLGFATPSPTSGISEPPRTFSAAAAAPIMSQVGFSGR